MQVRKAVITAAAPNQNRIPTQQLVDREGKDKSALQLILEEVLSCGVEEICMVIRPGDQRSFEQAAGDLVGSVRFVEQPEPIGYADAILRAKAFVADEPFLHLVGDHLYLSASEISCARQLVHVASEFACSVSAVQSTRENKLPYFGIVSGTRVPRQEGVFEVQRVVEKPTPTRAEQELVTPGLRSGHYLGFFGMHVLTHDIIAALEQVVADKSLTKPTLSDALDVLRARHKYMAFEVRGTRYNLGIPYGLLISQLAIALSGQDRDHILTELVDLLAQRSAVIGDGGRDA
ncbi:UTP--glucose-1-phosphate uridylyltransferase [Stieleria maiorica]|uniref:UTP--glucose-1-phosphate uridylyltransferase n=1 Tax=Stieleria maiorica TaxID=2795974 RepID=A0A5B9MJD2_9BACT|nr:sugar phosphate nucleotidyltransferase [Stieleria maiorica]QEG01382.1 UTP--glucose-1-phosphate uridylyltransferase [Stieleria maiorica]